MKIERAIEFLGEMQQEYLLPVIVSIKSKPKISILDMARLTTCEERFDNCDLAIQALKEKQERENNVYRYCEHWSRKNNDGGYCYHCYYEDLEAQRLLIKLPCAVGQKVYYIGTQNYTKKAVFDTTVDELLYPIVFRTYDWTFGEKDIGKTVFLTKEAAEKALKEMEDK